jgi:hypothetical protein
MAELIGPFEFRQCISILKSTGRKAGHLRALRDEIALVSDDCIYHHTCQYFLKGHILEYTNDFAQWAGESLEEKALAERLSSVDPYEFENIGALRAQLAQAIDEYLSVFPEPRGAIPGDEFYFNETVTLIFPVGIRVWNLAEFLMALKYIDTASIYYHFYEARTRLGGRTDDFSKWIEDVFNKKDLARTISSIDPFMHSLEEIKKHIVAEVEEEVRRDMQVLG